MNSKMSNKVTKEKRPGQGPILINYLKVKGHFYGIRFIFECGSKLAANPMVVYCAANLYSQFFRKLKEDDYDIYLIAATTLYLAGKIENHVIKYRDIVNVAYATLHRNSIPLDSDAKFWSFKDGIISAELFITRQLAFHLKIDHPQKYLVHYLKTLEEWVGYQEFRKEPISKTAWAVLQDFYHHKDMLNYTPQALAVAAIQFSLFIFGAQIPLCKSEGRNCWPSILYPDIDLTQQEEIMLKMVEVHKEEEEILQMV